MVNTYLIVFSKIDRDDLKKYLEGLAGHKLWFHNLENSIYVNTELTAQELSDKISAKYGNKITHIIVRLTNNDIAGVLPKDHIPHIRR